MKYLMMKRNHSQPLNQQHTVHCNQRLFNFKTGNLLNMLNM